MSHEPSLPRTLLGIRHAWPTLRESAREAITSHECLQRRDTRETLKILGAYRVFSICVSRDAWIPPALLFFAAIWDYSQSKTHSSVSASNSTPTCMWAAIPLHLSASRDDFAGKSSVLHKIRAIKCQPEITLYSTTPPFLIMIDSSCYPQAFQGGEKASNQQLNTTSSRWEEPRNSQY